MIYRKLFLRKVGAGLVFLITALCFLESSSPAASVDPGLFVKEAVDDIVAILQDDKLAAPSRRAERKKRMVNVLEKKFDFREMAMRALGRNWQERTNEERDHFVQLFKSLLENTYIAKMETYSGERVVFKKTVQQSNRAIVYTDLIRKNIETPVNYKLKNSDDRWMVYDVEVEGVSLVNNYRTQFASVLDREKFAGLVVRLEEKVSKGTAE